MGVEASDRGPELQHIEIAGRGHRAGHRFGRAVDQHVQRRGGVVRREGLEALRAAEICRILGERQREPAGLIAPLEDMDDAIGVADRERPEQHRLRVGIDGGVGADAEGQRQDAGRRETGALPEQPDGRAQVMTGRCASATAEARIAPLRTGGKPGRFPTAGTNGDRMRDASARE